MGLAANSKQLFSLGPFKPHLIAVMFSHSDERISEFLFVVVLCLGIIESSVCGSLPFRSLLFNFIYRMKTVILTCVVINVRRNNPDINVAFTIHPSYYCTSIILLFAGISYNVTEI